MSFAMQVKEEVVSHTFNTQQKLALLSGFIKYNSEIIVTNGKERLRLNTSSNKIARSIFAFCKELFDGQIEVSIVQSQLLKKNKTFQLTLIGNIDNFLEILHIYVSLNDKIITASNEVQNDGELMRAYLAGVFIAVGSVNSPQTTNYHLEVQFKEKESAKYFLEATNKFGFSFKILKRNQHRFICYLKKSAMVSDFLKLIDASRSVLDFENQRISRDMVNNINRIANIDIYNQTKSIVAAEKQIAQIKKIKRNKMMHLLPVKARALCELRLTNYDASFNELQHLMNQQGFAITKSGISNLFKTISKFSEDL